MPEVPRATVGIPFVKGHGTENDFILLPDPEGLLDLTVGRVRALTDRRRGLGADGVLRMVPTSSSSEVADQSSRAEWFMDYRNADGSAAEMCGNGARLFARYLLDQGLATAGEFAIATRSGVREVTVVDGDIAVGMGPATAVSAPEPVEVSVGESRWEATGVLVPNPHAVVFVDDLAAVGELTAPPVVSPSDVFPEGCNIEFVKVLGDNHVEFRVFERGVGETRSCGTGACAVAWAHRQRQGQGDAVVPLRVDVPGGRLTVRQGSEGRWVLSGPTLFVATGHIDRDWWKDNV